LKEEKAIVSEIAGTTRDAIEDTFNLHGITFRFIDTAGLRETTDIIESLGIEKTYEKIANASIIILLIDIHQYSTTIKQRVESYKEKLKVKKLWI
jgi:tRNA modification GTPase